MVKEGTYDDSPNISKYQIGTVPDFETDSRVDDFPVDEKGFRIARLNCPRVHSNTGGESWIILASRLW